MEHTPSVEFHHPKGFLSLAKNVGIKDNTLDLTVIYSTVRARAAAMFTRNRFPGAPVIIGRKHIANGYVQALGVAEKTIRAFAPGALVVALGLDASEHDPLAGLAVTTEGFRRLGTAIARIGLPTVFVQEGGYLSEILGANLTSVLAGFGEVR